jgi:hypothetical protein
MLGDTISLTYNAVAKVLSKINQDAYSAVYLLRSSTEEFRLNVRHITESAKAGVVPFERHSFELTHTVFATPTTLEVIDITSFAARCKRGSDPAVSLLTAKASVAWLTDANIAKLIAWES